MRAGSKLMEPAPPVPVDTGGGGGWSWLVTARGVIEAELIRGVLESAGIVPVVLDSRDGTPGAWMFMSGNMNRLVRVYVPASLLDGARLELLDAELLDADADAGLDREPEVETRAPMPALRWLLVAVAFLVLAGLLLATLASSVT
jgi:hypothetical protein